MRSLSVPVGDVVLNEELELFWLRLNFHPDAVNLLQLLFSVFAAPSVESVLCQWLE